MEDLLKWALSSDNVSIPGVLLTNLIVVLVGLHKRWMVPGWIYTQDTTNLRKERDEARTALAVRNAEDKESVASLQGKVSELSETLIKRQVRRQRRDQ